MDTARSRRCGRTARCRRRRGQGEAGWPCPLTTDPVLIRLTQWLGERGGRRAGKCALKPAVFTDTGRGLLTTRAVAAHEVLVSIPKSALVTCNVALADPVLGRAIKASRLSLKAQEVLTLFLLYQRALGVASEWKPYLDSLPHQYTVPAFCSPQEKSCLPNFLSSHVAKQEEDISTCLEKLQCIVAQAGMLEQVLGPLEREEVAWGWFTVNTRAVYLPAASPHHPLLCDQDVMALAPFLDLLNHSPAAQVTAGLNDATRCYEVVTRRPCPPWQQAFISYGPHHNLRLLLEYGFSVPHNSQDYLPLQLCDLVEAVATMEVEDGRGAMIDEKAHLICNDGLDQSLSVDPGGVSWGVEAALTVFLMTGEELREWRRVYRGGGMEGVTHRGQVLACLLTLLSNKVQELTASLDSAHTLPHHTPAFTACLSLQHQLKDMVAALLPLYQAKIQTCTLHHG